MTVKSGFFDSVNADRLYNSADINSFFDGFVSDGVLGPVGNWLQVIPAGGMSVYVGTGKAWFRSTFLVNTQDLELGIVPADANFDRIDIVALDFNQEARVNNIIVVTGVPDEQNPTPPALLNTTTRLQVPLAEITVGAGVTSITSTRIGNRIGIDSRTPFSTGLLQQASVSDLMVQWTSDYYAWRFQIQTDLEEIDETGTLQELNDIRARVPRNRNFLINGGFVVNQRGVEQYTDFDYADFQSNKYPLVDRWTLRLGNSNCGTWTLTRVDLSNQQEYAFQAYLTGDGGGLQPDDFVIFQQRIEASVFGEALKGTPDAKPVTLGWDFKTNQAGFYVAELVDQHNNRTISYNFYHPGNGGYERQEWAVPADFTGPLTQDESLGIEVNFWLAAGDTYAGGGSLQSSWGYGAGNADRRAYLQTDGRSAVGRYFEWKGIQLEIGTVATTFEIRPYVDELAACERYMQYWPVWHGLGACLDTSLSTARFLGPTYSTTKRGIPTLTVTGGGLLGLSTALGTPATLTGMNIQGITQQYTQEDISRTLPVLDVNVIAGTLVLGTSYHATLVGFTADAEL